MKFKPFTKSEMKMLIFNKVKRGQTYNDACKELEKEIEVMKSNYLTKHKLSEDYFKEVAD